MKQQIESLQKWMSVWKPKHRALFKKYFHHLFCFKEKPIQITSILPQESFSSFECSENNRNGNTVASCRVIWLSHAHDNQTMSQNLVKIRRPTSWRLEQIALHLSFFFLSYKECQWRLKAFRFCEPSNKLSLPRMNIVQASLQMTHNIKHTHTHKHTRSMQNARQCSSKLVNTRRASHNCWPQRR